MSDIKVKRVTEGKHDVMDIYLDSEDNRWLMEIVHSKERQIEVLKRECAAYIAKMEKLKPEMMLPDKTD